MLVARYKEALVRNFRSRQLDAPPPVRRDAPTGSVDNVTSIFDRDSTADPTVAGALARGEAPPEGWESELRARIRNRPEVREALERCWPVISGAELVNDLFGFSALTRSAARDILDEADMARLHRRRDAGRATRSRGAKPTSRSSTKPTRCSDRSRRPDPGAGAGALPRTRSTPRTA